MTEEAGPVLVVDGFNLFIRNMMVVQTMASSGELVGGTTGFLRSLAGIVSRLHPKAVYVVWEQGGASPRRKHLYPEYKANRVTTKGGEASRVLYQANGQEGRVKPPTDTENKLYQLQLLTKALGHLPVCQVYVQDTEADDVVAYIVKRKLQQDTANLKVVVSNDKDFYQLLEDPTIRIYDPARKMLIDAAWVKEQFGISPRNITLARAVVGDTSDNINGIPGVGLKTVHARFAELGQDDVDYDLAWLKTTAAARLSESKKPPKCYQGILEGFDIVDRNWRLMYLDTSCLTPQQMSKVDYRIDNYEPAMNRFEFIKSLVSANIAYTQDLDTAFNAFKTLAR